jgi:hypothetical protein
MWWHNPFKHLACFFLFPSMKFQPISFKIQLLNTPPQNRRTKIKAATCLFFWCLFPPVHFEFFAIFSYCLHFVKFACLFKRLQILKQEWQKSPAWTRKTYGKNYRFALEKYCTKKIRQIIKDHFYLPFFLLIILWTELRELNTHHLYKYLQSQVAWLNLLLERKENIGCSCR